MKFPWRGLTKAGRQEELQEMVDKYEKTKRRHATEIVLRALIQGHEIDHRRRGLTFKLFEGRKLLVKANGGESWIASDVPLSQFIGMCSEISDEDLLAIGGNTALAEINQG